uniref:AD domain-containing protein n=1 Tax=Acrobeloides nanus TaxID=290746 RepID=A0A914BX90_9BILA
MDIPIHSASCSDLIKLCGRAIRVKLITKKCVVGNLYTVDPESKSIVIVECRNDQPENLVLIPGESIMNAELLSDDEINESESCAKPSLALDRQLANMFRAHTENVQDNKETPEERKKKIEEILQKGRVRYDIDAESSIIVGAVKIKNPYTKETCISTNNIALSRITKLLESVFQ